MDYSKVTMMEYQEKKRKIFESLGAIDDLCIGIKCNDCPFSFGDDCIVDKGNEYNRTLEAIKAVMDYEIPIDWRKVEVDTLILVKSHKEGDWVKRYFAKYEDEMVFAFGDGRTSQTANGDNDILNWRYSKLVNTEGEVK